MTRRTTTSAAALAAVSLATVLALAGCDYLLDSPFPAYVPLMTDQANVADEMPWEQGAHYELRVVGSPSGDYVWIYGEGSSFRERFALYDESLHLVLEGEETGDTFHGDSPLIFTASNFNIGARRYDTAFVRLSPDATWNPGSGYYDGSEYDFPLSSGTDDFILWDAWSTPTTFVNTFSGPRIDGSGMPYSIEGLSHDVAGGRLALYARAMGTNKVVGVVKTAASFRSNFTSTVVLDPGAFTIFASSGDFDQPMFAGDGTVIRYYDDDRLVFYDLKGIEGADLTVKDTGDMRIGFSPEGGHWYIFDPRAGRITKARTWW